MGEPLAMTFTEEEMYFGKFLYESTGFTSWETESPSIVADFVTRAKRVREARYESPEKAALHDLLNFYHQSGGLHETPALVRTLKKAIELAGAK